MAKKPKQNPAVQATADISGPLAQAVNAVKNNMPFYATKEAMAGLLSHPSGQLVEFNETIKNPANPNEIAFRATALGMAFNPNAAPAGQSAWGGAPTGGAPTNTAPQPGGTPQRTFTFKQGIPVPAARRGGKGQNAYGFEQMNVGDCFDIPPTTDNPSPAKRVASTVSSASKRLAPKQFIVRSVEENGVKLARVWRTS